MMRLSLVLAAVGGLLADRAAAQGFDPFRDYHLHGTVEFQRKTGKPSAAAKPKPGAAASSAWAQSVPGEDDAPQAKPKLQASPAVLDGGARPPIAAEAPASISHSLPYAPGSVVVDTKGRQLLYVLSSSHAYRYPISVGRVGFTWTGSQKITRVASWPDWHPPAEMRRRDPRLPVKMTGGLRNPLGARALYLGSSLYRIHGTNDVKSIGHAASSGCFRMRNAHVLHLSGLARVGTTVHVLASLPGGGSAKKRLAGARSGRAG